jgi:hypothetical protein
MKLTKQIQIRRAGYFGAKRRNDSLERRMDELTEAIQNRKMVVKNPKNSENSEATITRKLSAAQVVDLKRKREELKNDLLLSNYDRRTKESEFKAIVKNKTSMARESRITIRQTIEKDKTNSIIKLFNTSSADVRTDLNSFKEAFQENPDPNQTQIKGALLKIIRKVNSGIPITNISKDMIATLHNGITRWDGRNVKIMEKV